MTTERFSPVTIAGRADIGPAFCDGAINVYKVLAVIMRYASSGIPASLA